MHFYIRVFSFELLEVEGCCNQVKSVFSFEERDEFLSDGL